MVRAKLAQWLPLHTFSRAAILFLLATVINGVIFSAFQLFFNFFILARGYDKDFLGLVNSVPSWAVLFFGLPLGMLSDRIGSRKAMLLGLAISTAATVLQVTVPSQGLVLAMAFIVGLGNSLYFISQAPFMMRISSAENRAMLFSLNFGLVTLTGSVGNLFAGQLPAFFSHILGVPADSAAAYQAVLLASVLLGSLAFIPIFLIHEPARSPEAALQRSLPLKLLTQPRVMRLVLPNLLIGFGAAILIPYMNVFFRERFQVPDQILGVLFSLSALLTGIGTVVGPGLSVKLNGKIRTIVITQGLSMLFLGMVGFSPVLLPASVGFLLRGALMNMAAPLFGAFCMEQIAEKERGAVNSLLSISWQGGWAVGPFISGMVQKSYGFTPLFLATGVLYSMAIFFTWYFFHGTEKSVVVAVEPVAGG